MSRTDRLLFLQVLDQTRSFAQSCEAGELHASVLRRRCEELLICVDNVMDELEARMEAASVAK